MKRARVWIVCVLLSLFVQVNLVNAQVPPVSPEEKEHFVQEFLETHPELVPKFFDLLTVMDTVRTEYVDSKSHEEILNLAIKGMATGLDPYGNVFIGQEAGEYVKSERETSKVGVGIVISKFGKYIYVIFVVPDSPAGKAGIEQGDIITKIDGKNTFGLSIDQIANLIKNGSDGSEVVLEVDAKRYQKPVTLKIIRRVIVYPSVESKQINDQIGYIKINQFVLETAPRFRENLESFNKKQSLIIDLRNNPGGSVDSIRIILGYLIGPDKSVLIEKGRRGESENLTLGYRKEEYPPKVVVLINNYSASASEIMAGNLKYYKIATLIGVRTFGKALVQTTFDNDASVHYYKGASQLLVKLTIARYLLPDGQDISSVGVEPDIEVEQPEDFRSYEYGTKRDTQLQTAIEFLEKKLKKK